MENTEQARGELKKFRVKLTDHEHHLLKLVSAMDSKYQYEVLASALNWARDNADRILPLTYSTTASFRSLYLEQKHSNFGDLEASWNCKPNNVIYTAIALYLRLRSSELKGNANILPCPTTYVSAI
ncbi:hypothetical protein [Zhongshania marina]|uniref:Uncharacterized protein n=1 Tax=Zhongshania marina TaxID=2304603 RepID=A0A2S4HD13_9GAMM|nr:hypothetical protein [Marortus luteolus]POP51581.1 hypothetical protein C0068_16730 [Marortus luteolus]